MSESWDTAGYIASSRYRASVCEFLDREGPELPSKIATRLDLAQPHVSRALSELRDRGVVELLVPESQQKGRLYGLTRDGKQALLRLEGESASVSVSFVEAGAFPYEPLVEYLREEHADDVRLVVARDGDDSDVFVADEAARDRYDERTLATLIAALRAGDATVDEKLVDLPTGEDQFVVRGYEHLLLVRLPVGDDAEVLVTLERDAEVDVNGFVDACRRRLRN
jgi:DNA-binding transcriptional ArsR family regulator